MASFKAHFGLEKNLEISLFYLVAISGYKRRDLNEQIASIQWTIAYNPTT